MKHRLQILVGLLVSGVLLWYSMREVRPGEVWSALRQANYLGFAALVVLTLLGFWLRAWRWRWLLGTDRPAPLGPMYSATMIGFMANNLLPLRLGEFLRAWALGRSLRLSKTMVFATVVVERVVDMVTLIAIFGLAMAIHPIAEGTEAGRLVRQGAGVMVLASLGLIGFIVALERQPRLARAVVTFLTSRLPERLRRRGVVTLDRFIEGLTLFRDLPRLMWVFFLSFVMFTVFTLCITVTMWAFGIRAPWYAGIVMLVITAIGIMVPAAPGYLGTLHFACTVGLKLFDVPPEVSVPFSWFYWAGQWIPVTVVGLICLRREGLSLGTLGKVQERPA